MLLIEWLTKNDLNFSEAARLFQCSRPAVHYYANGRMRPGAKICARIFKVTKGEVTANDHQEAYQTIGNCGDERKK